MPSRRAGREWALIGVVPAQVLRRGRVEDLHLLAGIRRGPGRDTPSRIRRRGALATAANGRFLKHAIYLRGLPMRERLAAHHSGEDMPEIRGWQWPGSCRTVPVPKP